MNKWDVVIFAVLLVVTEMLIDAVAGDYIKQWISEYFGTIPVVLGVLAVIVAVWLRVWKYESLFGRGGKGMVKMARKGTVGFVELAFIGLYILAALAVFNVADLGEQLQFLVDFSWLICIGSVLVVMGSGKKGKKIKFTGLEGVALIVAIVLPLAAAGYLAGLGIDISSYLTDSNYKLLLWGTSVASCIVVATQD